MNSVARVGFAEVDLAARMAKNLFERPPESPVSDGVTEGVQRAVHVPEKDAHLCKGHRTTILMSKSRFPKHSTSIYISTLFFFTTEYTVAAGIVQTFA